MSDECIAEPDAAQAAVLLEPCEKRQVNKLVQVDLDVQRLPIDLGHRLGMLQFP